MFAARGKGAFSELKQKTSCRGKLIIQPAKTFHIVCHGLVQKSFLSPEKICSFGIPRFKCESLTSAVAVNSYLQIQNEKDYTNRPAKYLRGINESM